MKIAEISKAVWMTEYLLQTSLPQDMERVSRDTSLRHLPTVWLNRYIYAASWVKAKGFCFFPPAFALGMIVNVAQIWLVEH